MLINGKMRSSGPAAVAPPPPPQAPRAHYGHSCLSMFTQRRWSLEAQRGPLPTAVHLWRSNSTPAGRGGRKRPLGSPLLVPAMHSSADHSDNSCCCFHFICFHLSFNRKMGMKKKKKQRKRRRRRCFSFFQPHFIDITNWKEKKKKKTKINRLLFQNSGLRNSRKLSMDKKAGKVGKLYFS